MLNRRLLAVTTLTALAACPLVFAQPRPDAAALPIKQIVLFSSGVGYYQRGGEIEGNKRVDLQFRMEDINDLLKSLVLEDEGGGQIATVTYDNRSPVEHVAVVLLKKMLSGYLTDFIWPNAPLFKV